MSFEEQERALFGLLFDRQLRSRFCANGTAVLESYGLSKGERVDFESIRRDALEVDAAIRADFVLSQMCRAYPLSFGIASSAPAFAREAAALVDTRVMRTPPVERSVAFGIRFRDFLAAQFGRIPEHAAIQAVVSLEIGMAMTAATLRKSVVAGESHQEAGGTPPTGWEGKPVTLASHVCATVIPLPYRDLRAALCPCPETVLWEHLRGDPLTATRRTKLFAGGQPRLLMARAVLEHASRCDVTVEHRTAELSEGFAPLLAHIDGSASTRAMLAGLEQAGAAPALLKSVETGFRQLLEEGMLTVAGPLSQ